MNEEVVRQIVSEVAKVPYLIRNVLVVVNCESEEIVGSNLLWFPSELDPRYMSIKSKCVLLSEVMKRMELSPLDLAVFLRDQY